MNKNRITLYIDAKVYQEYKIYSIMINKNVSSLIEEYMINELNKMKKKNNLLENKDVL